ncbi:hypothetical protein PG988_000049 [Apiospora saccharicola]
MEQEPAHEQARAQQQQQQQQQQRQEQVPDHYLSPLGPAELSVVTFSSDSPPPPFQAAAPTDLVRIPRPQLRATLSLAEAILADGYNWTVLTGYFGEEVQRSVAHVSVSAATEIVRRTILGRLPGGGVPPPPVLVRIQCQVDQV